MQVISLMKRNFIKQILYLHYKLKKSRQKILLRTSRHFLYMIKHLLSTILLHRSAIDDYDALRGRDAGS